jgi:hypothetical protein
VLYWNLRYQAVERNGGYQAVDYLSIDGLGVDLARDA